MTSAPWTKNWGNAGAKSAISPLGESSLTAEIPKRTTWFTFSAEPALSACIGVVYFLFCLAVQASTGAWRASFVAYPDEPSHFVGAVMVRDWLLSGQWTTPLRFAQDYRTHYPFFALGYWPPAFSVVTALDFLVAGVGRVQALLIPAVCAAFTAWLIFRLLRQRTGVPAAVSAGAIYLSFPAVQTWFCAVMVDHMTACLCIATAVCLLRYLEQPGYANGVLLAVTYAVAILSKYSGAYLVVLPWAAVLLFRRRRALLREPSFLIQPVILALLVGPWVLWTKGLAYSGLPAAQPALTAARAAAFLLQTFKIFPPALMAVVILGLLAMLALPGSWREDIGVLSLLCAGHLSFLFLSPVGAEQRYVLAPAAALLVIAFAGWAAALERMPGYARYRNAAQAVAVVLAAGFVLIHYGDYPRPKTYPIQSIVETILKNRAWADQRIVLPSDLEGAFIAEFVTRERHRPSCYLVRPTRTFARSDWFGGNYSPLFNTSEQMLDYFRQNPVALVIWHEHPEETQQVHERLLDSVLRHNPSMWHEAGQTTSWAIYEQVPQPR